MQKIESNIILVKEDYDTIMFILRGGQASRSLNGKEALDLLMDYRRHPLPDVILLDLNMPVMGGFEFLDAFRQLRIPGQAKVQIVILSSSDDPVDIRRASEMGIHHYITKPVSLDKLGKVIHD